MLPTTENRVATDHITVRAVHVVAKNPILVDVRAHLGNSTYANMLRAFEYVRFAAGHFVTKEWVRIEDEVLLEHANRVLRRLAALEAQEVTR
jgi:hypothetical protein